MVKPRHAFHYRMLFGHSFGALN
jgi:hypothetical protein